MQEKSMKRTLLIFFFFVYILSFQLQPSIGGAATALPKLVDITDSAGITFVHSIGDDQLSNIVESAGVGCAFVDYDRDNDLDIYLVNAGYHKTVNHPRGRTLAGKFTNALFRNDGNGSFTDVTTTAGVGDTGYGMAVLFADYDNDEDPDLYVTNFGKNTLYKNNGDGTFTDVTETAGVGDNRWSLGCTFLDIDNDGWLDLYVGNYLAYDPDYQYYYAGDGFPGPLAYQGQPDVLYRNRGDGTFEDITEKAGVFNPQGRAMGVSSADFNDDGFMDIFVANDAMENYMYKNNGDGTFTNIALLAGTGFGQNGEATSAMSPEFGDFDLDGKMDILIPDMAYSSLYLNTGSELYTEVSSTSGLASICGQFTSWSGNFFDFNADTLLDIFITNGDSHFYEPEEDLLLLNTGQKSLQNVSTQLGDDFFKKGMGRGSAIGDIDNDGDLDILVTNINGRPFLYRNDIGNKNHWLMLDLKGTTGNLDALGTRVVLTLKNRRLIRQVMSSSGYLSQSDKRLHFGLGNHTVADKIEIFWPNGKLTELENTAANQVLTVNEPQ